MTTAPPTLTLIGIDQLVSWQNVRAADRDIAALAASIKRVGILEPLLVVVDEAHEPGIRWVIVAGNRRHAAAKLAGVDVLPCIVRDDWSTQTALLEAGLAENLQRDPLTPREETVAFERLTLAGMSPTDIGKVSGRKGTDVSKRLSLLNLPEPTRARVWEGQISMVEAEALASIEDPEEQEWMEKFAGSTSFAWKRSQWKYEKARRLAAAEKKAAKVKEREEYKSAVAAAKRAGEPLPPKPSKPVPKVDPWQAQQEKRAARAKILKEAAEIAAQVRLPWVENLIRTQAKTKTKLPAILRALLQIVAAHIVDTASWQSGSLSDRDREWLGVDPETVIDAWTDAQLITAIALAFTDLSDDLPTANAWEALRDDGPKLMVHLVERLAYPISPEETELASGLLGTDPPKAVRKPPRRKPTVVQAGS